MQKPQASSDDSRRQTSFKLDDLSGMVPAAGDQQVTRRNAQKSSRHARPSPQQDHRDWFHRVVFMEQPMKSFADKERPSMLMVFDRIDYTPPWSAEAHQDFIRLILDTSDCASDYLDVSDYDIDGPVLKGDDAKVEKIRATIEERCRSGLVILVGWGKSCMLNTIVAQDLSASTVLCCIDLAFSNEQLTELIEAEMLDSSVPLPPTLFVIGKQSQRSEETERALPEYLTNPKNGVIMIEGADENLQLVSPSSADQQRDVENQIVNHVVDYIRRVASSSQVPNAKTDTGS